MHWFDSTSLWTLQSVPVTLPVQHLLKLHFLPPLQFRSQATLKLIQRTPPKLTAKLFRDLQIADLFATKQKNKQLVSTCSHSLCCSFLASDSYHGQRVEAGSSQQMTQVVDGGERRHVWRKPSFSFQFRQLQRAAKLVKSVSSKHGTDKHPVRFKDLVYLERITVIE